jgi:hypothetical protein
MKEMKYGISGLREGIVIRGIDLKAYEGVVYSFSEKNLNIFIDGGYHDYVFKSYILDAMGFTLYEEVDIPYNPFIKVRGIWCVADLYSGLMYSNKF